MLAGGTVSPTLHSALPLGMPRAPASREGGRGSAWLTASQPSGPGARQAAMSVTAVVSGDASSGCGAGLLLGGSPSPPRPGPDAQGPPSQGRCVEVPVGVSAIPPVSALPGRELSNCTRDRDSSRHARFWTGILFQNLPSRSWFCDYGPLRDFSSKSRH